MGNRQIICGFHVNVVDGAILLPKSNIDGSQRSVAEYHIDPGNFILTTKAMWEFRGHFAHWAHRDELWRLLAGPVGGLLGLEDASGLREVCEDRERRFAFRHAISCLTDQSRRAEDWVDLFRGCISSCVPWELRLFGPEMIGPLFWLSGDAALTRIYGVNWSARTIIATTVGGLVLPFTKPHIRRHIIADVERLPIAFTSGMFSRSGGPRRDFLPGKRQY